MTTISKETTLAAAERRDGVLQRSIAWLKSLPPEALFTFITLVAMLAGWGLERAEEPLAAWIAFAIAYAAGGYFGLQAGFASLRERQIDVDLLMVLAAIGAALVGAPFEGAMLLFLFSLSNVLQDYAMDRTRSAIKSLMKLRPTEALVWRDGESERLPIEAIAIGTHILVRPGERLPMDGTVVAGESTVNQATLTGEPLPIYKGVGDDVLAGTLNENGSLEVEVTRRAQDSTIAKLIKLVEEAHSEKAETQRFLDKAEQYYAAGVILFTTLVILVPILLLNEPFQPAFYRAMTIMVAASPCALIISTPAAILSAIGNGARRGVLFKGGIYVEQAANIKAVAFDKTGTLTAGTPHVTELVAYPTWTGSEDELLACAAAVEERSEHVLARAVVAAAAERDLPRQEATDFRADAGFGVEAVVDGCRVRVGTVRYFRETEQVGFERIDDDLARMEARGETAVIVARMSGKTAEALGLIGFADTVREDAQEMVRRLKAVGVQHVVMLTGDNERAAAAIAQEVGVDEFYAALLPEDKVTVLKDLKARYGVVAMVGDGINDAPALATANIGIAMGAAGTDVALETADIVLMADDLSQIPYVIGLSRKTRRTLIANLSFAALMIAIMITAIFSVSLSLPLAVIGHEGGTVLVSLNGLRLLAYRGT